MKRGTTEEAQCDRNVMNSASEEVLITPPVPRASEGHSTGSRLLQNTVSNVAGQSVIVLLAFVSTPYITRRLGATQYGALSLLMTYLFAFSVLNLGINTSLVKYLAELIPKSRMSDMQDYLSTSLTVLVGSGALIGAVVCALAGPIVRMCFKGPPELIPVTVVALRIASVAFILQFLTQVVLSVPTAMQRFEIVNVVRTGSEVVRIAGTVVLLWLGHGLPSLMGMVLFANVCTCIAYGVSARRLLPGISATPRLSRTHLAALLRHSRYVVLANVGNQIVSAADVFIIGYLLPVANVAYYGIAYTVAQRLGAFLANIVSIVFPAASSFAGTAQSGKVTELYLRGMKLCATVGFCPAVAVCVFSRPFLLYWLGADYAREGAVVLRLLTLGFLINSFSYVPYQILQGTHHAATAAKGTVAYTIINVTLFVILIPRCGILGAAVGFVIAQLLFVPLFIARANRLLGVSGTAVIVVSYMRPVCTALLVAGICSASLLWVTSIGTLVAAVALEISVYALSVPICVLDRRERAACWLLINTWLSVLSERGGRPHNA